MNMRKDLREINTLPIEEENKGKKLRKIRETIERRNENEARIASAYLCICLIMCN